MFVCFFFQIPLTIWAVFYPRRCAEQAELLVETFMKVAGPMGVRLEKPFFVELRDDRTDCYIRSIHCQLNNEVRCLRSGVGTRRNQSDCC